MAIDEAAKSLRKRKIIFYTILFFFILGLICAWYSGYLGKHTKKGMLELHGWVEGDEINLSSKVTGNIVKLAVDEGGSVKNGDFILQMDSAQITARLEAAKAEVLNRTESLKLAADNVAVLESKLVGATIGLELSQKQSSASIKEGKAVFLAGEEALKQAEFNFIKAKRDYDRFLILSKKKNISQSQMDNVEKIYHVCIAEVERAKKNLDSCSAKFAMARSTLSEIKLKKNNIETLKKMIEQARTKVEIAKSLLEISKANEKRIAADLSDTCIYSPVNGTVIEKFVELGEHVVPGTPVVLIVDMDKLYIKTYVEQIFIGKIKYNDIARIYVDSFPDRYFEGKLTFISSRAEFTPRDVQMEEHRSKIVYRVEISVQKNEGILKPGMPADVMLKWDKDVSWN